MPTALQLANSSNSDVLAFLQMINKNQQIFTSKQAGAAAIIFVKVYTDMVTGLGASMTTADIEAYIAANLTLPASVIAALTQQSITTLQQASAKTL